MRLVTFILFLLTILSCITLHFSVKELSHVINYDILFTPQSAHFLFYNKSGFITRLECRNVRDCVDKLYSKKDSIRDIVTFDAIYNFTANPMGSGERYNYSDTYFLIILTSLMILFGIVSGFLLFSISEEEY